MYNNRAGDSNLNLCYVLFFVDLDYQILKWYRVQLKM